MGNTESNDVRDEALFNKINNVAYSYTTDINPIYTIYVRRDGSSFRVIDNIINELTPASKKKAYEVQTNKSKSVVTRPDGSSFSIKEDQIYD